MAPDVLEKALDKLWVHGGVRVTPDDQVSLGAPGWQKPYEEQRRRRLAMLDEMAGLAEGRGCRMQHVVRHFGDREDSGAACGQCDVCAPAGCWSVSFRAPAPAEAAYVQAILEALRAGDGQSTGRLCRALVGEAPEDRRRFEGLLGGLAQAGLVEVRPDAFEKDGKTIRFERAYLTAAGRAAPDGSGVTVRVTAASRKPRRSRRGTGGGGKAPRRTPAAAADANPALASALRQWRLEEARRRKIPAFRILTNAALQAIAEARPQEETALLAVPGMGPKSTAAYGKAILDLCR
jgi:DNA topoisomerase-3